MGITIYGASDDLIEIEGDIREEFNALGDDDMCLALSDGTLLSVEYSGIGVWRFHVLADGACGVRIDQAPADDEDNYSDRVHIDGEVAWVTFGKDYAKRPKASTSTGHDAGTASAEGLPAEGLRGQTTARPRPSAGGQSVVPNEGERDGVAPLSDLPSASSSYPSTCPTCGARVKVETSTDGTSYYVHGAHPTTEYVPIPDSASREEA